MFGKLVAALRKEHLDEYGHRWTQRQLAHEANLSEATIGKIERGERYLHPEELAALAQALRLSPGECQEFFQAAATIDKPTEENGILSPENFLEPLLQRMHRVRLPSYLIDSYCDILAVNAAVVRLFDLSSRQFDSLCAGLHANAHMLRFVFSSEFDYRPVMHEHWHTYALHNMLIFRALSLRYRATPYFADLFNALQQWHLFTDYWQRTQTFFDNIPGTDYEDIRLYIPRGYGTHLAFFSAVATTLTPYGKLYLCVYVALETATEQVFAQIVNQASTSVYRCCSWPEKQVGSF